MTLPEGYAIRPGTLEDCPKLPPIELAAARQFVGRPELGASTYDLSRLAPVEFIEGRVRDGLLFVLTYKDEPVGFAFGTWEEGDLYLGEVDVHPDHAGKRLGKALIETYTAHGFANGAARITLSTFTEIPWNRPYYERLGFRVLPESEWNEFMRKDMAGQAKAGLDPSKRCFMMLGRKEL